MYGENKTLRQYIDIALGIPALLWVGLFLIVPGIFLVWASFYSAETGFSLSFYGNLIDTTHLKITLRSLILAACNAVLCMTVAYPIAYYIARFVVRGKAVWLFFLTLPFWVNFLIHVYSWFFVLERNGVLNKLLMYIGIIHEPLHLMNSLFAIVLVMFHTYLPFMVLPLYVMIEKLNPAVLEASSDLGANDLQTFWRVTLPLTLSGAQFGFFLVFILSYGEYVIPTLLGGGKTLFVGTLISEYFLLSRDASTGAAFTVVSALILIWALVSINWSFRYLYYRTRKGEL